MAANCNQIATAGILGLAVGDALGVPVEFCHRDQLRRNPVTDMRGYGTHNQPPGTWSDDTSLTLCLVESLCDYGVHYEDQARRFISWMFESTWTPHGRLFDIGITTREAIFRMNRDIAPTEAGLTDESCNGNGSLMRILPIALYLAYARVEERSKVAMLCSRLTHGHVRSQLACAYYVELSAAIVRGNTIEQALNDAQRTVDSLISNYEPTEGQVFARLLSPSSFGKCSESEISGSGYVIHCLEASIWCALNAKTFSDGVLAAVNLGDDTDTTGAVTGGLLGLCYGVGAIPENWSRQLARQEEVLALCRRFEEACQKRWRIDQRHAGAQLTGNSNERQI